MNDKNPFAYGLDVYAYVIALSSAAGLVRFLNTCVQENEFKWIVLLRDLFTGILTGLMAFWTCEFFEVVGPLSNVAIVIAGVMGIRAVEEIKSIVFTVLSAYTNRK